MFRLSTPLLIFLVAISGMAASTVEAARIDAGRSLLQAPVSDEGLALLVGRSRAEVIAGSGSGHTLRLRRGERLEAVAELAGGFAAAGVRESPETSHILVLMARGTVSKRLPSLPKADALQLRPVLLVEDDVLSGAAWLEGPDPMRLRVKTCDWDGEDWGPVTTVSRRSAGSQTGLAGVIMRDGQALLVWSQFDGRDDEIYFSVREDSAWSPPARAFANNQVPDIAPSVTFTRRGALIAWSRFDGSDYRLWTARLERGRWKDERQVGPAGSLYPELMRRQGEIYALIRNAAPTGWSVRLMTEAGNGDREAFFAATGTEKPLLLKAGSSSVSLAWPQTGRVLEGRLEPRP